jgi:hypothetical protein
LYCKYKTQVILKGITMTDTPIVAPVSASGDNKPSTPATPQQNQANPPKPADKPSEQQK